MNFDSAAEDEGGRAAAGPSSYELMCPANLEVEPESLERADEVDEVEAHSLLPQSSGVEVEEVAAAAGPDWYGLFAKAIFLATGVYWGVGMQLMAAILLCLELREGLASRRTPIFTLQFCFDFRSLA